MTVLTLGLAAAPCYAAAIPILENKLAYYSERCDSLASDCKTTEKSMKKLESKTQGISTAAQDWMKKTSSFANTVEEVKGLFVVCDDMDDIETVIHYKEEIEELERL